MGISPEISTYGAGSATDGKSGRSTRYRILHRSISHCGALALALLTCIVCLHVSVVGQEERPQITPGERKAPRKKEAGPRAVAVLQLAANGKASLVPIAILINGKFWDASAYKADPVPMALDSGNVYEAEQSGSSLGLFTVDSALHSNAVNSEAPWLGTGAWRPFGGEEPPKAVRADNTPVGIDTEDAPPRLTHDTTKKDAPAPAPVSAPSSSPAPPAETSKPSGKSSSGDEPPRLSKSSSPPATPPAGSAGGTQPAPDSAAPSAQGESKPKDVKASQPNVPASDSGTSEVNRPRLRRGKPAESFADEEVPGYSRPGSQAASSAASTGKIVVTAAAKSDVKLIPAISDASGPAPHSFAYQWLKGDEEDRRKQVMDMAKEQVRAYVDPRSKAKIVPKTSHAATATARRKPAEPILENVQMIAYDLWNSNQPIIIFSAQAHMPPPPAGTAHSEVESELEYSIFLVTYPDIYNNLHKLYLGVTDKFHLDVTPRLDLIDAVDADGDGRGELLLRETSDAGSGWVIYRVTGDKLWKLFDSLNP